MRRFLICRTISCGLWPRMKTTVPCSIGGTKVAMACPNMWLSGRRLRNRIGKKGRPYFLYFRISFSTGMMLARTLRWVRTTPFGSAVAPDVKMISTTSSRVTATGVKAGGSSARKSMSDSFHVALLSAALPSALSQISHVIAEQQQFGFDDACDMREKVLRRAIVDRHGNRSVQQASPQRDDPLGPVLAPEDNFVAFAEARALQARGKSARGIRGFRVRIRTRAISVVVHEKRAPRGRDIVEEIE